MEHPILTLINKPSRLVIGFMSGTSADGVDAALVRITAAAVRQRPSSWNSASCRLKRRCARRYCASRAAARATAADFCRMNFLLGKLYCEAGLELCRRAGVAPENIDLIGNHGQTFWHIPVEEEYLGRRIRSTLQLGGDALLAEPSSAVRSSATSVCATWRRAGLAAPLVPVYGVSAVPQRDGVRRAAEHRRHREYKLPASGLRAERRALRSTLAPATWSLTP